MVDSFLSCIFSTCRMPVRYQDETVTTIPVKAHAKNRFDVPTYAAETPERSIPNGVASDDSEITTDITRPCISRGTTVWRIVLTETFATGIGTVKTRAATAMT